MKKSLLLSAALVAASSGFAFQNATPLLKSNDTFSVGPKADAAPRSTAALTRGEGAIDFTYSQELYGALALNGTTAGKSRVFLAFEMSPVDIKAYAGNKVTGFTVISPTNSNRTNPVSTARFFYTTTFEGEDYAQDFDLSKTGYDSNFITLDTPYTITGEEETLAFGYSLIVPKGTVYYIPVDGVPNNNPGSSLFNVSNDDSFPPANQWVSAYADYGALCMSIKIEGGNLPENMAVVDAVYTPMYLPISGEGADVELVVRNAAINPISSVEVTASMTDAQDIVQTFELPSIAFNESATLTVTGVKGASEGFGTLAVRVSKVNGVDSSRDPFTTSIPAYDNGYPTKIVAEDATGTWCGWCPGGIEALEYLKQACPDRAIAIGVHNGDEMAIESYQDYIEAFVSEFPNVMYNRTVGQTPTDNYSDVCEYIDEVIDLFDFPSYVEVNLTGATNDDKTAAKVKSNTTFVFNTDVPHYLSFVVVEDNVGPYVQKNYFSNNQYGLKMNGWESKGANVKTVFNDVARCYVEYPGIKNSLPSNIEADVANEFEIELPLDKVKNDDYRVIAFVTNALSGRIVNACEIELNKNGGAGVSDIIDANAPAEYYNLNGMKVAEPTNGIFIRRQGTSTEKVVIR